MRRGLDCRNTIENRLAGRLQRVRRLRRIHARAGDSPPMDLHYVNVPAQPASLWHILFNMLTLWCVGPVLERMMGHLPYLALYVLSGLGGSAGMMVWALFSQDGWLTSAYGASGALFGLFAAILVVYQRIGIDIRSMLIWMLINFLMPIITPNIAWQAHVGGFIIGGVFAWLLVSGLHALRGKSLQQRTLMYGVIMLAVIIAIVVACNMSNPLRANPLLGMFF